MTQCSADTIVLASGSGFDGTQNDWENCLITMVRTFSGDLSDPPVFSDDRILQVIRVAAFNVSTELSCCEAVCKPRINPCTGDMEGNPLLNAGFTSLLTLKAACIIDQGLLRDKARTEGVKAVCGPATLQVMNGSSAFSLLFQFGPCMSYQTLKEELCFKCPMSTAANCELVVGAFAQGCSYGKHSFFGHDHNYLRSSRDDNCCY